ncbi:MAG TPA: carboxypeptidase regulatory-like domain-containing protein [Candidatus Udaeobacter sp.]|nr:carboxypeptidase regulatory-like domain-containing protein [Candidatus Udaeobacter sp.]
MPHFRSDETLLDWANMRVRGLLWFNALLSMMPATLFAGAVVEGRVELPKSHSAPVQAKRYEIVTKGGVLSTQPPLAVVYLEGPFRTATSPPPKEIAQKGLTFIPALLPVQVGTKIEFPNLDDTYHNIFSYSPAKRFDLGRYRPEERPVPAEIFDKPGLVTLRCDIHEHMRGLILVLNTPYFVMSNPDGRFRLSGLPAGHYTLKAWINSRTTREKPVDLKDGETLHVDFP